MQNYVTILGSMTLKGESGHLVVKLQDARCSLTSFFSVSSMCLQCSMSAAIPQAYLTCHQRYTLTAYVCIEMHEVPFMLQLWKSLCPHPEWGASTQDGYYSLASWSH